MTDREWDKKLGIQTCGADGCYYSNGAVCGKVPSLSNIQVVDTTGAGDIFGGSAVYKLLETNQSPDKLTKGEMDEIVTFACTAAGLSATKHGGISSVPEYDEVMGRIS